MLVGSNHSFNVLYLKGKPKSLFIADYQNMKTMPGDLVFIEMQCRDVTRQCKLWCRGSNLSETYTFFFLEFLFFFSFLFRLLIGNMLSDFFSK